MPTIKTSTPTTIAVTAEHHIAQARQAATALASEMGFKRVLVYYIATSVSELAGNIFFHTTRGGSISLRPLSVAGRIGLEVIAEDDGPGIPDIELVMQDGFSTGSGLGGGLPGTERLMDEFKIRSTPGEGTRIVARKWQPCQ